MNPDDYPYDPDVEPGIEESFFDPDPEDGDAESQPASPPKSNAMSRMITLMIGGVSDPYEIGCRALIAARLVHHPHAPRTVREMASRMKCSPSEAHRRGTRFLAELAEMMGIHGNHGTGDPRV